MYYYTLKIIWKLLLILFLLCCITACKTLSDIPIKCKKVLEILTNDVTNNAIEPENKLKIAITELFASSYDVTQGQKIKLCVEYKLENSGEHSIDIEKITELKKNGIIIGEISNCKEKCKDGIYSYCHNIVIPNTLRCGCYQVVHIIKALDASDQKSLSLSVNSKNS